MRGFHRSDGAMGRMRQVKVVQRNQVFSLCRNQIGQEMVSTITTAFPVPQKVIYRIQYSR